MNYQKHIETLRGRLDKVAKIYSSGPGTMEHRLKALRLCTKITHAISKAIEAQAIEGDAHSCRANARWTEDGPQGPGSYCDECGAIVYLETAY